MPPTVRTVRKKVARKRPPQPLMQYVKLIAFYFFIIILNLATSFRWEYLWPLLLLIQGILDSYKFTGLYFAITYIFAASMLDISVFLWLPQPFLFILATCGIFLQKFYDEQTRISNIISRNDPLSNTPNYISNLQNDINDDIDSFSKTFDEIDNSNNSNYSNTNENFIPNSATGISNCTNSNNSTSAASNLIAFIGTFCIIMEIVWNSKDNYSFNQNFCKPFAAHCLGYPLLQIGTRLHRWINSSLRLRNRHAIREKNEYLYRGILYDALGIEKDGKSSSMNNLPSNRTSFKTKNNNSKNNTTQYNSSLKESLCSGKNYYNASKGHVSNPKHRRRLLENIWQVIKKVICSPYTPYLDCAHQNINQFFEDDLSYNDFDNSTGLILLPLNSAENSQNDTNLPVNGKKVAKKNKKGHGHCNSHDINSSNNHLENKQDLVKMNSMNVSSPSQISTDIDPITYKILQTIQSINLSEKEKGLILSATESSIRVTQVKIKNKEFLPNGERIEKLSDIEPQINVTISTNNQKTNQNLIDSENNKRKKKNGKKNIKNDSCEKLDKRERSDSLSSLNSDVSNSSSIYLNLIKIEKENKKIKNKSLCSNLTASQLLSESILTSAKMHPIILLFEKFHIQQSQDAEIKIKLEKDLARYKKQVTEKERKLAALKKDVEKNNIKLQASIQKERTQQYRLIELDNEKEELIKQIEEDAIKHKNLEESLIADKENFEETCKLQVEQIKEFREIKESLEEKLKKKTGLEIKNKILEDKNASLEGTNEIKVKDLSKFQKDLGKSQKELNRKQKDYDDIYAKYLQCKDKLESITKSKNDEIENLKSQLNNRDFQRSPTSNFSNDLAIDGHKNGRNSNNRDMRDREDRIRDSHNKAANSTPRGVNGNMGNGSKNSNRPRFGSNSSPISPPFNKFSNNSTNSSNNLFPDTVNKNDNDIIIIHHNRESVKLEGKNARNLDLRNDRTSPNDRRDYDTGWPRDQPKSPVPDADTNGTNVWFHNKKRKEENAKNGYNHNRNDNHTFDDRLPFPSRFGQESPNFINNKQTRGLDNKYNSDSINGHINSRNNNGILSSLSSNHNFNRNLIDERRDRQFYDYNNQENDSIFNVGKCKNRDDAIFGNEYSRLGRYDGGMSCNGNSRNNSARDHHRPTHTLLTRNGSNLDRRRQNGHQDVFNACTFLDSNFETWSSNSNRDRDERWPDGKGLFSTVDSN